MDIRNCALSLVSRHETCNPFQIAKELGIIVIFAPLNKIRGFYQYVNRCHIIYINEDLDERGARFVCAHELGHYFLHKDINRIFMDNHTHFVMSRYEIEADQFAAELLFDDWDLQEFLECPIATVAQCLGIDEKLARYRMETVVPTLW